VGRLTAPAALAQEALELAREHVARRQVATALGELLLVGGALEALDEAAMYVATSEDRSAARMEVARVLHALVNGLLEGEG